MSILFERFIYPLNFNLAWVYFNSSHYTRLLLSKNEEKLAIKLVSLNYGAPKNHLLSQED